MTQLLAVWFEQRNVNTIRHTVIMQPINYMICCQWWRFVIEISKMCCDVNRPVTRGAKRGEDPLEKFSPPPGKICWT